MLPHEVPITLLHFNDEAALGSDNIHEHEKPLCGRPRKPRPLIHDKIPHGVDSFYGTRTVG
jgi:hypothetical protein